LLDGGAQAAVLQGVDDAAGERVGRGQHAVQLGAAVVVRGQQGLHALLRGLLLPALRGGLVDVHLPGGYLEGAVVVVRLAGVDGGLPEQGGGVVVVWPGQQLHVQRRLGGVVGGLEARVEQAQAEQQRVGLVHADGVVVEGDGEVHFLVVREQAVV